MSPVTLTKEKYEQLRREAPNLVRLVEQVVARRSHKRQAVRDAS